MVKKATTKKVPQEDYKGRLTKALGRMETATLLVGEDDDSALVLAVQAVIAGADALTIRFLGERSSSERHEDLILVLKRLPFKDVQEASKRVSRVLSRKSAIEYGGKPPKPAEVHSTLEHARKFLEWVELRIQEG